MVWAGEGDPVQTPEELEALHIALVEEFVAEMFGAGFLVERVGDEFVRVTVPADGEDDLYEETGMDFDASQVVMIEEHADGSSTVTFHAPYYDGELAKMVASAEMEMTLLLAEGVFASVKSYEYSDDFDVFDVGVNGAVFLAGATYDSYSALLFGNFGLLYQVLDGQDYAEISTLVEYVDVASGELVGEFLFPEQFDDFEFTLDMLGY